MREPLKRFLIPLLILSCCAIAQAQQPVFKQTIYFKPGQVSIKDASKLSSIRDSIKNFHSFTIEIQGNADSSGKYPLNQLLSEKRANAAKELLMQWGIPGNIISIKSFGPDNPVASNKTRAGRNLNRRVDIILWQSQPTVTEQPQVPADIRELYQQTSVPFQTFCINPNRDTSIRCIYGTVIHIRANSIKPTQASGNTCVTFKVKEVFLKSDMILENLSTVSDGRLLESQAMIYVEAVDARGNQLELQKGKDLVIIVPTDSIRTDAGIFDGQRGHDDVMNWTMNNNSVLSNFRLADLDYCGGWMCGFDNKIVIDCEPCEFFFCRMGRVGRSLKGIFSRNTRQQNPYFRRCLDNRKYLEDTTYRVVSTNPLTLRQGPPIDRAMVPTCQRLEDLFKKYGVTSVEELLLAINKPLLDTFKVSTLQQLKDTLYKINRRNLELKYLNKTLSYEDMKYYVYNVSRFGWSNVDCFASYSASKLTTMTIDLKPETNVDCKLVFKNIRAVVTATKESQTFEFKGVPRGEPVVIVAIKFQNGSPFLSIQEVNIERKAYTIDFKELGLDEFKAQLRLLDQ